MQNQDKLNLSENQSQEDESALSKESTAPDIIDAPSPAATEEEKTEPIDSVDPKGTALKKKKPKPPVGYYVSGLDEKTLAERQKQRSMYMLFSTLLFAVTLILPTAGIKKVNALLPLLTLYVIIVLCGIIVSVIVPICAAKVHKIVKFVDETNAPKRGFSKRTFYSFELFMIYHFVLCAMQIALMIYAFDVKGLISTVIMLGSGVFAFMARYVSYTTYCKDVMYLPPVVKTEPTQDK